MMKCQAKYIISSVSHLELSRSMHRVKESFVSPKFKSPALSDRGDRDRRWFYRFWEEERSVRGG